MLVEARGVNNFAAPDFCDLATQNRSFSQLGAYATATFNLSGGSEPELVNGARISVGLLPALGVQPLYGRNLAAEEEREGATKVVLLGHGLWLRQYGADPRVVIPSHGLWHRRFGGQAAQLESRLRAVIEMRSSAFRQPFGKGRSNLSPRPSPVW